MESSGTYFQPFFDWLVRTTLQASVLVCLILLIQAVLGNKLGIRWRYCLWLVLLVRMVLPWAPQSRMSMFNLLPQSRPRESARPIVGEPSDAGPASGLTAQDSVAKPESASAPLSDRAEDSLASRAEPQKPGVSLEKRSSDLSKMAGVLPLLWLAGAGALGGYIVVNNIRLWRIVQRERPLTDQKILDLLEDCKSQIGTRTILAVVATDRVSSPALFGFVRPRLLLPADMIEGLDLNELRYVFLHELAHLKRHDIFIGYAVSLLQVLHWFNPLVWLGFRQMQADRELAADGLAMSSMQPSETPAYGHTIVRQLERFLQPRRLPSLAGISESKAQMKRRMAMIAKFKKSSYRWSPLGAILLAVLGCVCLCNAKGGKSPGVSAAKPWPGMTLRQVRMESGGFTSLSPDGKYLCDVDWDTGNLVLSELATGNVRPLTDNGSWEQFAGYATISTISRDSKKVAFLWFNHEEQCFDLREIGLDGSGDRVVRRFLEKDQEMEWLEPAAWSPDGKQILVRFSIEEEHSQIAWVSTADGSVRTVKALNKSWPGKMDVSPDGRYIVYDLPQEEETSRRDIFAFDIEENREVALVQHPADDKFMGWTPDGRHIFFTSNRMASWDGWILPVARGEPSGLPELVKASIGDVSPIGFTPSGAFYYTPAYGPRSVYTAALDLQTGEVLSSPKPVRHAGTEELPDWSPDGRYLAYCTRPRGEKSQIIHIRSVETGQERQLDAELPYFHWLRWSPDGRSILVAGLEEKNLRNVVYKVDVLTGERTVVLRTETGMIPGVALSPDGKALFYSHWDGAARSAWFMVRDLETGHEEQLVRAAICPHPYLGWALSPDGKQLAFILEFPAVRTLNTISTAGGQPKELLRMKEEQASDVAWTPDSRNVLFMRAKALWRIPAEGGEPRKLWTWEKRHLSFEGICVHPDGRNLAFDVMEVRSEVWVMENFLPGAPVAKPEPSISLRRVKTGPMSDFSSPPSLDGRYLCDLGAPDAEGYRPLAVRDLVTGEVRPLTEASRSFPWCPVISPDSKRVAYVCQSWSPSKNELQLIGMDGTEHRVLYRLKEDEKFHIRAWTPDGKKVLGAFKKGSESLQLVAFSIEDGSMQVIYTFDTYWPMWQSALHKVAISPDGRYIAYDRPPEKGSWNAEIYILDIEHRRAECVVQHPAYDKLLGWTPDGNHIFFTSDRRQGLPGGFTATNTRDAYLLPVAGGKTQGPPVLIKSDIPDTLRPKGFTSSSSYHYTVEFKTIEAVVAELDLQTGKLLTKPQAVGQTGAGQIPAWSPDGRLLAYGIHKPDQSQTIRIQDIETGGERELDPNLPHFSWLRWSPDGKSFLVSNFAKDSPRAIYRINADTGERLTMVQSESSHTLPGQPQLSADGSMLYYVLFHSDSDKASLLMRDIESGHEEELFALEGTRDIRGLNFALSPDGRQLALATEKMMTSAAGVDQRIFIMPAKGGEPRELWKTEGRATRPPIAWTADGQALLFTKRIPEGGRELWLIPAGGGQARKLCSSQEMMCPGMMYGSVHSALDMHPDGQRIAFDCFEYRHEVWVLENFLPTAVAKRSE